MSDWTILSGDCIEQLATLESGSINCCVTSPPYYGLRDYGHDAQIGLEATPQAYVAKLVEVFREVRRVLRDDGTLWLNLGDSYATGAGKVGTKPGGGEQGERWRYGKHGYTKAMGPMTQPNRMPMDGFKPKDMIGIPWRVAFALQADGWWLRQDIIWHKPNPMPESVRDRCTKAHEYLFLLSKSERYYFDSKALAERATGGLPGNRNPVRSDGTAKMRTRGGIHSYADRQRSLRNSFSRETKSTAGEHGQKPQHRPDRDPVCYDATRNKRSVWTVSTKPFKGAHFATFPPKLVEPCVLAGCPLGGTVLDPFGGSGTTAAVAIEHGRKAVLCEINEKYIQLAERRIAASQRRLFA